MKSEKSKAKTHSNKLEGSSNLVELSDFCQIKEKIRLGYIKKIINTFNEQRLILFETSPYRAWL